VTPKRLVIPWLLLVALALFLTYASADDKGQILEQKGELEKIQEQVKAGRKKLEALKEQEKEINRKVSSYDQKIATNTRVINRLNKELAQLRSSVAGTEEKLEENQIMLERVRRRYLGNIRLFYMSTVQQYEPFINSPNSTTDLNRRLAYLSALADFESGNVIQASQLLEETDKELNELTGQRKNVARLKQKKETSTSLEKSKKRKQEKDLTRIRQQETEESDIILTLEQAAQEMERIIARLEEQQARREQERAGQSDESSIFATLRGQLLTPFRGKIVSIFGHQVHPVTKLKSFSPGISIKGKPGGRVVSVASGSVAYVGNLRGYGNFVIINHDNLYYTTYAGLSEILTSEGEYKLAGSRLGLSGADGIVKFELRKRREPLDPVKWIKIDSF